MKATLKKRGGIYIESTVFFAEFNVKNLHYSWFFMRGFAAFNFN